MTKETLIRELLKRISKVEYQNEVSPKALLALAEASKALVALGYFDRFEEVKY